MKTPLTDEELGARVRAALDELTAHLPDEATAPPALTPSPAGRRLAMAAAAVLVIGGGAAIGLNLASRDDTGSADTVAPDSTAPATPSPSTPESTATTPASPAAWVVLASQDLVPGEVHVEQCCRFPVSAPPTVMAWASVDGLEEGLLLLTATASLDGSQTSLEYASNGFTAERTSELTSQVVPGSGIPYVLPDPGVTLLGFGLDGAGSLTRQHYYSNDRGTVTITVGDYRGQLTPLLTHGFRSVDLPGLGVTGYRTSLDDGGEYVVWQMPNGQWATLEVPGTLADRTDGLLAALGPAVAPTATG